MRKITIWVSLFIALAGCGKKADETIVKGEIENLTSDTLYIYGIGGLYEHTDTIIADEGEFSRILYPDTTAVAALLLNHETVYPLFLERGNTITIKGSANGLLEIKGNTMNEEFAVFQKELSGLKLPSGKVIEEKAEAYIVTHPSSFVSLYLLDKYFVQKESPEFAKIKMLVDGMIGLLQDTPYIQSLKKQLEQAENTNVQKMLPYFSLPNIKGEHVNRTGKFNDKYLIIHFWASWSEESMKDFSVLREINRTYASEEKKRKTRKANEPEIEKKKGLGMLGISFEIDKATWKEVVKKDSLVWEQVSDLQGFNSELANQFGVLRLPATFLISPEGRIIRRNISIDSLSHSLKDLPIEKR